MDAGIINIVLVTVPNEETALHIARSLVEKKFAACVGILPGVKSVYRWQGAIEEAEELLLVVKTTAQCYPLLEAEIRALHPYEVPEIVALAPSAALESYSRWILDETLAARTL
ncbi:MAG TPA: divalent-cation tolerance protein CutA [Oligoflexia bacterium]|nr:divalent-cation tolerance protein CutA [Oligoflexia bacterium]